MATTKDTIAEVTARLVEQLENGVAPWVKSWDGAGTVGFPVNAISGKRYHGANVVILWSRGYSDTRWLTFNQARSVGGSVRRGEKATQIVFWRFVKKNEGTDQESSFAVAKTFSVFNVAQCDLPEGALDVASTSLVSTTADELAARAGAVVRRGEPGAFYSPAGDTIGMPALDAFASPADYDSTLLHELTHWTGHASRCARTFGKRFGDSAYAAEELVAELGAAFMCALLGVEGKLQHAEYLGHWAKLLKADRYALFTAAREAEKAVEFLMPTGVESEEEAA